MRVGFTKQELAEKLRRDMEYLFKYLDELGQVLTIEDLYKNCESNYEIYNKLYQKYYHGWRRNSSKFEKRMTKFHRIYTCLDTAFVICDMLHLKDTSSLSRDMINEDFINRLMKFIAETERRRNMEVEATGESYPSYLYQNLNGFEHNNRNYDIDERNI